jgi:hypothetical protein
VVEFLFVVEFSFELHSLGLIIGLRRPNLYLLGHTISFGSSFSYWDRVVG